MNSLKLLVLNITCALQLLLCIFCSLSYSNVNTFFKCRLFQATKEEEELSAEERRKLERKLKKERKKKEKQLMREAGMAVKKVVPKKQSAPELALAYLTR